VYSVDPSGQAEARLTEDGISRNGAFSPDGTRLAYISGTSVYIAEQ
jgi:Tol biopolymer transport system component